MTMTCRLAKCIHSADCAEAAACVSITDHVAEYRHFIADDAMPNLRHVLTMIDNGKPIEHVRIELQAMLIRAARTI